MLQANIYILGPRLYVKSLGLFSQNTPTMCSLSRKYDKPLCQMQFVSWDANCDWEKPDMPLTVDTGIMVILCSLQLFKSL